MKLLLVLSLLSLIAGCTQRNQVVLTVKEKTNDCAIYGRNSHKSCYYVLSDNRIVLLNEEVKVGDRRVFFEK